MAQLFIDFVNNLGDAMFALALHASGFFMLFYITQKQLLKQYLTLADQNDPFINADFKIDMHYFLFNKIALPVLLGYSMTVLTVTIMDRYLPYHIFANQIESLPFLAQLLIAVFIADAAFFFPHWFCHKFLWRFHSIHHSAEKINWTTAVRLHPVDEIPFIIGGALTMHIVGFEGLSIIYALAIHNVYNMFVHANLSLNFPKPLCYILGSPNYHRWHHAAEKEAIDKNLATMFPVFDLLFGTYYYPQDRLPHSYGLYEDHAQFPKTFGKQLIYPFMRRKK